MIIEHRKLGAFKETPIHIIDTVEMPGTAIVVKLKDGSKFYINEGDQDNEMEIMHVPRFKNRIWVHGKHSNVIVVRVED